MLVSELYAQVAGLGFQKAIEDDDIFYQAVNRGIYQVNAIRPHIAKAELNHKPQKNLLGYGFKSFERYSDLLFEADGVKAYYFECDGNGTLYIERENNSGGWSIISSVSLVSDGRFVSYRGFVKDGESFVSGRVRLRFAGEYIYSVRFVAMYEHLYSANEEDITAFEPYSRYDLSVLLEDFVALVSDPFRTADGVKPDSGSYDIEGGRTILLAHDAKGCYTVSYKRNPREVINTGSAADNGEVIDLDEELCALLVLNVGVYLWADDEPEKAEYYLNLYRERAAEVEKREKTVKPVKYTTNGW